MPNKAAVERLGAIVAIDQEAKQARTELEKVKNELRDLKAELKDLKALDPHRMKRNLAELKKKMVIKNAEIQSQSKEILSVRKMLREAKHELNVSQNETDAFFNSPCKRWELSFTGFQYANERPNPESVRVRCLDRQTGTSVIADRFDDKLVVWSHDIGIPNSVTVEATEKIIALKIPLYPG